MAEPALQSAKHPIPSTWISANAGSGKTTTLVNRVLSLLLHGVAPERICCITYTKAAAGEMRERILSALRELLVLPDEACRAYMQQRTGQVHDLHLARSLFARVLDSPLGGLQLTTIHGFCQQILRRFPLEADLSPQFSVLEEAESESLQRVARQRLLEQAEGELADALALIAERGGESAFNELIRSAARQAEWWQNLAAEYPLPTLLKSAIYAYHGVDEGEDEADYRDAFCGSLIDAAMVAPLRAALPQLTSATERKLAPILTAWLEGGDRAALLNQLLPLAVSEKNTAKKLVTKSAPLQEFFTQLSERCAEYRCRIAAMACAEESYAAALMSQSFLREYEFIKQETQALDYDDLIRRTEQLLKDCGGWVMSKLDHRIDHLLIDEAQDTSPGQWRIARTLVEELMVTGGGIGSGNLPRSLLVVGDEKQSIFSFQGADARQFFSEQGAFTQLLEASGSRLEPRALTDSYRSAKAVLDVVDAVAALPPVARALSAGGVATRHILTKKEAVGRVTLHAPGEKKVKEEITPFQLPTEYRIRETPVQVLANRMAADIKSWIDAGRAVPGDILILLWRRQPFADCLIRALARERIPVAGIDRLRLSEHLAVRDLMALMRWCDYPGDDLSLAHVLRSPIIGMDEATLEDLAFGRKGSLWEAMAGANRQLLERILPHRAVTPYDFLTHVLEVFGARTRFAERFGEEVHEVLDELKAQAAAMPRSMAPTLAVFQDWITRSEREIKRQQETQTNNVRIMTVHGAKGLEAPIVLLVNPSKQPDTGRETMLREEVPLIAFSEDAKRAPAYGEAKASCKAALFEEYYRLLYVALTRAKNELHLYAAEPPSASEEADEKSWYSLVAEAMQSLPIREENGARVLQDSGIPALSVPREAGNIRPLPAWAQVAPPAARRAAGVLSPSRLVDQEIHYGMASEAGANIRGVRIHRVLQFLTAESDRNHMAQLHRLAGGSDDKELDEIARLHAQERWLWEHPAYPEVNVGGLVEGQRYGGQIDRLVMTPEAVVIVDYKTGAHVPATAAEVSESYRLQLKIYRELLRQIYPEKSVRAALLWTNKPQLMWMDEALEATAWPNLTKM